MFYSCVCSRQSPIAQAGLESAIGKDRFELPILLPHVNVGCISVLHLIPLLSVHLWKCWAHSKQKPVSVLPSHGGWFSLSSNGATEITSESFQGTVDCQVAPMKTAVYCIISHIFLSLSLQNR